MVIEVSYNNQARRGRARHLRSRCTMGVTPVIVESFESCITGSNARAVPGKVSEGM